MRKYSLEVIVFIGGAVVMILELVGSRLLGPYLGNSIYVWTSLIGVILGSLSIGYWLGGRLADKKANHHILSTLLLTPALLIVLTTVADNAILTLFNISGLDIRLQAILSTFFLLGLPSIFLGMISPYAIRLKMRDLETSGRTVGNLYAIATVGSIFGTFLAGFFLIAYLGITKILLSLALVLVFASALSSARGLMKVKVGLLVLLLIAATNGQLEEARARERGFIDTDTQYSRVWIFESQYEDIERPIRVMFLEKQASSAMFLDDPEELVFPYTRFYRLAKHFRPDIQHSLMIGGAGYSYPKDYLSSFEEATMDVVEIDPGVTQLARQYFNLEDDPRLTIYHEDGRTFINNATTTYDSIFGDAFSSRYSLPFQLTTLEATQALSDRLEDGGVVIINVISALEGRKSKFLRAEYATLKAVFPQVLLFPVDSENPEEVQNVMVVAIKSEEEPTFESDDPELQGYLDLQWQKDIPLDLPLLTDDYVPVDHYTKELLK